MTPGASDAVPAAGGRDADPGLLELLREDWRSHSPRPLAKPGFHAIALHRFGFWMADLPPALRLAARVLHDALYYVTRVLYGIELPRNTRIGRRVVIYHQGGIVIGWGAEIGDDSIIRQNVTIGATVIGGPDPKIGKRVDIGAGAAIVGGIEVGDDAVIGPNAVVMVDVPPGSRVVAPPGRIFEEVASAEPRADADSEDYAVEASPPEPDASGVIAVIASALRLDEPIGAETPLLSSGLVDSFAVVVMVEALEEAYGVSIDGEDVRADTFDTPRDIAAMLAERRA